MDWIIKIAIYLAVSFVLSALIVRIWPKSWVAKQIRQRLLLFPALPLLVLIYVAAKLSVSTRRVLSLPRRLFEILSGQKLQGRRGGVYDYEKAPKKSTKTVADSEPPVA